MNQNIDSVENVTEILSALSTLVDNAIALNRRVDAQWVADQLNEALAELQFLRVRMLSNKG